MDGYVTQCARSWNLHPRSHGLHITPCKDCRNTSNTKTTTAYGSTWLFQDEARWKVTDFSWNSPHNWTHNAYSGAAAFNFRTLREGRNLCHQFVFHYVHTWKKTSISEFGARVRWLGANVQQQGGRVG